MSQPGVSASAADAQAFVSALLLKPPVPGAPPIAEALPHVFSAGPAGAGAGAPEGAGAGVVGGGASTSCFATTLPLTSETSTVTPPLIGPAFGAAGGGAGAGDGESLSAGGGGGSGAELPDAGTPKLFTTTPPVDGAALTFTSTKNGVSLHSISTPSLVQRVTGTPLPRSWKRTALSPCGLG